MPDISVLIPVLLLIRVVLDNNNTRKQNRSYRFEFAYFLIFPHLRHCDVEQQTVQQVVCFVVRYRPIQPYPVLS